MKYAKIDSTNDSLQQVVGWYDAGALDYPNEDFTSADFVKMTDAQWGARLDTPYYDPSTGKFGSTPPAPTLAEAQSAQIATIQQAYGAALAMPQSFTTAAGTTKSFTASTANVQNVSQMLLAFNKSQATPSGFYFKSDDGTKVDMTYADLQGLAETLGSYGNTQWQHLDSLRDQVEAATTVSAVQAITWS